MIVGGIAGLATEPTDVAGEGTNEPENNDDSSEERLVGIDVVEPNEWISLDDLELIVTDAFLLEGVNSPFGWEGAAGVLVAVQIELVNRGNVSIDVHRDLFFLVDDQNRAYEPSSDHMTYVDNTIDFEVAHPDLSLWGGLLFDVPEDQEERYLVMVHYEISEDEFVAVNLGELDWG